jgi:hypothetical protein
VIIELLALAARIKGVRISDITKATKEHLKNFIKEPGQTFLLALLVIAILWYFYPSIGLASYPGGDDKVYDFVTRSIIDQRTALAPIEYPYAQPYMDHLLQAGLMVVASFFCDLLQILGLPTSIPIIHLSLALLSFSLIPISMYLLTVGLTRNRMFSSVVALTTLFIWDAIPLYFYWGGTGEALGYFLVPVFALFDYRLNVTLIRNSFKLRTFTGAMVVKLILAGIALYIHIYTLFLFAFLVIVATPLWAMRNHLSGVSRNLKGKIKVYLRIILPYVVFLFGTVIILIGAMALLQSVGSSSGVIGVLYGYLISSPQEIMSNLAQVTTTAPSLVFRNGYGLVYSADQLASNINTYLGYWGFILLSLGLFLVLYLRLSKSGAKVLNSEGMKALGLTSIMLVTAVVFFIFSQDSPFGWYYIPYPMVYEVYTGRLYYELSLIVIYVMSLPLYLMYLYVSKQLFNESRRTKKGSSRGSDLVIRKHDKTKKVAAIVIVIVVAASVILPAMSNNYGSFVINRGESVITQDDLAAFSWIETNTPANATFFANYNDAGGFIYIFTGRTVLSPSALRAAPVNSSAAAFNEAETALQEGNITQQLIQLLRRYSVSYVYVGEKYQYGGPGFNTIALAESPYFEITFHQGGAYIFRIIAP